MTPEGFVKISDKKESIVGGRFKVDFCLYCDPDSIHGKHDHDRMWETSSSQIPNGQKVEVQYESKFGDGYWEVLPKLLRGKADGVHAPTKGRDIASSDEWCRKWSLEETKRSMDLADRLGAKYFVLHLTPQDDFQDRNRQLERGFISLEDLVKYYKDKKYGFKVLPEILEHPKSPADKTESVIVLERAKKVFNEYKISGKLGFCLDVGHLWHNLSSLLPQRTAFDFKTELDNFIKEISRQTSIDVVHLVGAYVEHFGGNGNHVTHAYPGLMQGQNYLHAEKTGFGNKPNGFNGDWMDTDTVLRSIKRIGTLTGNPPIITIEAHDPKIENQLIACQKIRDRIRTL